ncbi:CPBP family intramembrane glutamic endopeptidase [Helcococcus kunzii]|uniref:CPBP family intramembrane glutamic endopeptidase n=1 Tax=Helcococcus kunzii TaxID=40091 RepID=UPI0024AD895F|nr:type II CAAX endopeptidase family protein [Helcococcus kunzii]
MKDEKFQTEDKTYDENSNHGFSHYQTLDNNNINLEEPEIDIDGAKSRYRKSILMFIVYFISNILAYLLLDPFIKDVGLINALSVIISIIPIYLFMGKRALKETEDIRPPKKLSVVDLLFFVGIMYLLSIAFSHITNFFMRTFNIRSINVTEMIQTSLNTTLFIYAVFIGPFFEELNYRGFHLNNTRRYGAYSSMLLSTLIFSFAHGNFMQGIGTLGIGFVLGYVAYFYSFQDAIILHILNNLIVSLLGMVSTMANQNTAKTLFMAFDLAILGLIVFAIISLFTKKRRDNIKKNLKYTRSEKIYLKALLTDPIFFVYILIILILMILPSFIVLE